MMTCIVGYESNGKVYIGADSAGVGGLDLRIREDSKVFIKGDMIFGFTSSFRMGQILQYKFKIPKQSTFIGDFEYLCSTFIDELSKVYMDTKYATTNNDRLSGGTFLLGYKGKLYAVYNDFQVARVTTSYNACGCGEDYALGALCATELSELTTTQKITTALTAAEKFSAGVSAPFNILYV